MRVKMKVADILPNPNNPRTLKKEQFKRLVKSLESFPEMLEARPLVVDKNNVVLGGNMRLKALQELGIEEVSVHVAEWDESKNGEFIIKDNVGYGEWDMDILANEWDAEELVEWGLDVWIPDEEEEFEPQTDEDAIPETGEQPITERGDLYIMGNHRLLCGDSTDEEDVHRLMCGELADLCFTSPPYGQQRDYNEAKEAVQDWDGLMMGVFANLPMKEDGQVLVNLGLIHRDNEVQLYWENWIQWMRENGWRRFGWYVWDTGYGLPGDWMGRFAPSFEFVFHFNKQSKKPKYIIEKKEENVKMGGKTGLRGKDGKVQKLTSPESGLNPMKISDSTIRAPRSYGNIRSEHPATFSVEFAETFVKSWDGIVYEPFAGSGTTIIAAEKNQSSCFAMELDRKYCDVIVKRWEEYTGQTAIRVPK